MEKLEKIAVALLVVMVAWLGLWNVVYMVTSWIPHGFGLTGAKTGVIPSGLGGWIVSLIPVLVVGYHLVVYHFSSDQHVNLWDAMMDVPSQILKYVPVGAGVMIWLIYPLYDGSGLVPSALVGSLLVVGLALLAGMAVIIGAPIILVLSALFDS